MTRNSLLKIKTNVHTLVRIGAVMAMTASLSQATFANSALLVKDNPADHAAKSKFDMCQGMPQQISKIGSDMNSACSKAGYGVASNCAVKALSCQDKLSEQSYNTVEAMAQALGVTLTTGNKPNSECPSLNPKDYKKTREDAEKRLRDAKKELAELAKDQADQQKDYDKTIADLMESLSEANHELTKTKSELEASEREKISEFQNAQKEAASQIRQNQKSLITLHNKLTTALRKKTLALSELTDATAKASCTREYNNVIKSTSTKSSGTGSYINRSKNVKTNAMDAFNKCMDKFQISRMTINDEYKATTEDINKEISNLESDNSDLNDNLTLAANQLEEIKKDTLNQKSAAEKKVAELLQINQTKMESAKKELETRLSSIQRQQLELNQEINSISNNLANMVAPPSGAELSYIEANSQIESHAAALDELIALCKSSCGDQNVSCESKIYKDYLEHKNGGSKAASGTKVKGSGSNSSTSGRASSGQQ